MSIRWRKQGSRIVDLNTGDAYDVNGAFIQNLAKTDPDLAILSERRFGVPLSASSKPKKTPPAAPVRKAGDKLQNAQPRMTQASPTKRRVIAAPQRGIHTMSGQLSVEQALANDPALQSAMVQRYGGNEFSSKDLVEFKGDGAVLQRQGVDYITPGNQLIDLKLRQPNITYDDLLLELMSVDKSQSLGRGYKPQSSQELLQHLSKITLPDKPGWTIDPSKRTDEIVYYMPGRKEVSFINAPALRDAVPELLERQFANSRPFYSVAPNNGYNTVNMPVSNRIVRDVLKSDIETIRV